MENSDGDVSSVPIVRDVGSILARRGDTWDAPYDYRIGFVFLNCASI